MIERLLVLILTCCLFLGVWQHDTQKQQSWRDAHRLHRARVTAQFARAERALDVSTDDRLRQIAPAVGTHTVAGSARDQRRIVPVLESGIPTTADVFRQEATTVAPHDLPLPSAMVPGEFRVVNHHGFVGHLTLNDRDLVMLGLDPGRTARDLHTIHTPDGPWYLIRITNDPTTPTAATSISAMEMLSWLSAQEQSLRGMFEDDVAELVRWQRAATVRTLRTLSQDCRGFLDRWTPQPNRVELSVGRRATQR
ncbi:MAG: hypothetical protein ABGZ17_03765 [Planctomycetaceae bacterium]